MKIVAYQFSLLLTITAIFAFSTPAEAQLFNRKNKNKETTGSSLFPGQDSPATTSSSPSSPESAIFRNGQPEQVSETSYVIENGQRVKQKQGLRFRPFGKKNKSQDPTFNPVPPVVPAPVATTQAGTAPTVSTPQPTVTPPVVQAPPANNRRGFRLPVPRLPWSKPDAPINTNGGEVLEVQDGVVMSGTESAGQSKPVTANQPAGNIAPPRKEGDTVIYGSWDQVKAVKNSAADAIVKDIKKQDAARKAYIEKMKKQQAAALAARKAAEEEARIRQMIGGGGGFGVPGGF